MTPWTLDQPGGVTQVVANLVAQAARSQSIDVALLFPRYQQTVLKESAIRGIQTITGRVASPWNATRPVRSILTLATTFPLNVFRLHRLFTRLRPAAVNVHFPSLSSLSLLVALRLACPNAKLVLSFHGSDLDSPASGGHVTRALWRLLVNSVDVSTCCSDGLCERFSAIFKSAPRARTIHNGLDGGLIQEELSHGSAPIEISGLQYVLSVGTFDYKKGQDVLVRAFAKVTHQHPSVRLVLVGRTGPLLPTIFQLVSELGLGEQVVVLRDLRHADALRVFAHAHAFVLSSREEAFGLVLLEAAHFGVPIVATAVGGVPEIVDHGVHGLLVPPDDADALSAALSQLLSDAPLRQRLVGAASERVAREFTWERAFVRYMAAGGIRVHGADAPLQDALRSGEPT